ncbi:4-hydroxythreonine-4-phosphate dehydrogenase PdxA [Salinibacterium sp. PAMC 21357]|uniref:4-hydroxythreonine-4-phosphate dehydrogenase PdxA n=1 Tax=Salinibacterium sp. PAMC 21357 TaxID=1112215 RepID=UPI000288416D|nr:4-hydroxythreonine-4-phosphate dehydrogenase PdxA [Salinibacterium sp. PAMC 21357]
MAAHTKRPRLALTLGDPAGVGPELGAMLLAVEANLHKAEVYILASASELEAACNDAGVAVALSDVPKPGFATLLDDHTESTEPILKGVVSEAAGSRAMHQLRRAVALANAGEVEAIVFTPLNKTSLHLGGMDQEDELRWFAQQLSYEGTTSELNVLDRLWTARVTSHVSLKEVAERVNARAVTAAIQLLHDVLRDSGVAAPRIGVAALNPHNGENGLFGREEIDEIAPGVATARELGLDASGPFPSDTIFLARHKFDGIVTQYHDQGQIAMKLLGFEGGVTVQGGLPVVIATPAHGTAFDIVGTGTVNLASTQNAFDVAVAVAGRRMASLEAQR